MLRQIYVDLANGKLSQQEALEKIEALRLQGDEGIGAALFAPVWRRRERAAAGESEFAERLVIVVDRPADGLRKATGAVVESLQTEPHADLSQRYGACALACFERIQAILKSGPLGKTLVQIVVEEGEQSILAGLAALLKTAALENPQFAGQVILTPAQMTDTELGRRLEEELTLGTEAIVRYPGGAPEVLRWEELLDESNEPPSAFRDGGVYLVTGGLGALGRLFVREVLDRAPEAYVVLAGRSPWDAAKRASVEDLCSDPGRLRYRQVDLGGLEQVERLIAGVLAEHGRLDGILHCAGMIADNFILRKSAAEFSAVLAPKVVGTFHLDRASRDVPLEFFSLFSSFAGAMGNVGQADYATANAFLDQFAQLRNRLVEAGQRHGRTRSINWPLWQAGGMDVDRETLELLRRVTGLRPMRTATGMRAFHRSLALPHSQLLVGEGDLAQMRRAFLGGAPASPDRAVKPVEVVARIDAATLAARTTSYLCREFSVALKLPAETIEPEAALEKYGIDSILAMKLTRRLEETFGKLSKTLLFEHQTIEALTRYFVRSHSLRLAMLFAPPADTTDRNPDEARRATSPPARMERISSRRRARLRDTGSRAVEGDSIAIIGLSGRYPESIDLDAYWRNLREGKDCIVEVPRERWDWHEYFSDDRAIGGHHYSKWGGFIAGVDEFDPLFFNISPKEAKLIDPQERLFLQHAWMALEDAGYTRASLQTPAEDVLGGQVGVYAGVMYSEYQLFGAEASARGQRLGIVGSAASVANRVSYALNLHGPSMTLDTMCSSALTAIHLACQDLKQGRTSLALAGGVNVSIHPNKYLVLSSGQFISSDGHCRSFGVGGDGYIPGEGVGVAILKRLSEAERDGDHIYGVIRGSALNHGGKTNGYTVPNPQAQADVITRALADARVDARHVSYIEAHGTGTKLGDPIEIAALSSAFGRHSTDTQFCLIGSAKSNIGHCESAAGIAGLTKVLLQMAHQEIVPSLHSAELNPFIDFPASPFVVNQSLRTWEQPVVDGRKLPRIAGISSFGAGGSNAHLIVEEYQVQERSPLATLPVIVPLSARTPDQLREKARDLLAFIGRRRSGIDLASMACTLQVGREAMDERVAFVVGSVDRLADRLRAYVAGEQGNGETYEGQARRNREALAMFTADDDLQQTVGKWVVQKRLPKLAELWVKGLELDWGAFYGDARPPRMSLPTYPFARERHWIDVASATPAPPRSVGPSALHPLLHANTSDLTQQSYRSSFTGDEPFVVGGALPAAAQLEMARAAVQDATPSSAEEPVEFRDVVWGEPIRVTGPTAVAIALSAVGNGEVDFEIYTQRGEEEIVHCQGRAVFVREMTSGNADLKRREALGERLVRLPAERGAERTVEAAAPPLIRREIPLDGPGAALLPAPAGSKPRGTISLSDPAAGTPAASAASAGRVRITLPPSGQHGAAPVPSEVRLWDRGRGIYSIEVATAASPHTIPLLRHALEKVQREAELKVLLLSGVERAFAAGGRKEHNAAVEQKLYQTIASFPFPVLAVLRGDVVGAAFTAAALCDFMVCPEDARYGYADGREQSEAVPAELALLRERFGGVRAQDVASMVVSGRELRARGWSCPILPLEEVEAHAEALAATFADKPKEALRLLKQHLARRLAGLAGAWTPLEASAMKVAPGPVAVLKYGRGGLEDRVPDGAGGIVLVTDGSDVSADVVSELHRLITESEIPVVAALPEDANGNAWLVSQLCDARVYSRSGLYSAADAPASAAALFLGRLGDDAGREVLLTGESYRGTDLQKRVGSLAAVERGDVVTEATKIAEAWAARSQGGVSGWRRAAATDLFAVSESAETAAAAEPPLAAAGSIPLRSPVVTATAQPEGIVVVRMEDRDARNMFSEALIEGVTEAFAHVEGNPAYKVVILTGYDSYFAAGGTRESLLAIQEGKARFTDVRIFELPLECKLPVIAAMQGHGLGAGWTMGLFADLVLMSEESRYVSPYMTYGFTPGAGATWILAQKLGADLARESLFSGRQYSGRELKERGLRVPVLPRAEVLPAALALARRIARVPRARLLRLKEQWTASVRGAVEETYRLELAMHEKTFVGRADTLARIRTSLWGEVEPRSAEKPAPDASAGSQGQAPSIAEGRPTVGDPLAQVVATLRTLLARELQLREGDIDEQTPFVDLGLDSISGVTWIRRINEMYRTSIEATKVYNHPTLAELSRHVKEEAEKQGTLSVAGAAPPAEAPVSWETAAKGEVRRLVSRRHRGGSGRLPAAAPAARPSPRVAIVGMAGQFPQARDLDEFWRNLAEGRNSVAEVSPERWNADTYFRAGNPAPGKTNSKWLGALDRYDQFDPLFFNISPTEAEFMDPQQRLFLQACWHAIEDAGYDARTLSGSKCGVFVGCATGDYHQLSRRHQLSAQGFTGAATSILAARIPYFLNLQGPCVSIDTACSSSLVALAQACDSLIGGGSDMALAGGVYVMSGPDMHIKTAQAGMLSAEGRCFTFDQRADGFVPGEAVGVVVLKRLEDARRDQDNVLGIIEGWGVNQDGKTNGITAPNPESQTRLMQEVYERHGIDPAEIQLVEAHGTGTKLGDPIEVEGLKASFGKFTAKRDFCALGSVKSNIGHCLTAAGIAGVIKLLLALKHRQLPPTINFEQLNEHIGLKDSPFYVNRQLQEWRPAESGRRQAAISAFGFSGTNAHLVIGEDLRSAERRRAATIGPGTRAVVPLSARTAEQLRQRAEDLLGFVRTEGRATDLVDLAYTLQVGRAAMDERVSFVVSSLVQLADKLEAYLRGDRGIEDVSEGQAMRDGEALLAFSRDGEQRLVVDTWFAEKKLSKLAELWVKGVELDWKRLWGGPRPCRIELPVYPFAGERYWIRSEESGIGAAGTAVAVLHPLLHRNTSDLTEHRYTSTFDGDEFFVVTDDTGVKVLPALACLEMVRAAIDQALPDRRAGAVLELLQTRWAGPILISGKSDLNVALYAEGEGRLEFQVYGRDGGEELVHCTGRAVVSPGAAPAKLDLEALSGQTVRLGLTSAVDPAGTFVLHPVLLERALHAALASSEGVSKSAQAWLPSALETLRVVAPLAAEMVAWVRPASERHVADSPAFDIDLAGEGGNVLVQLRGLAVRPTSVRTAVVGEEPPSDGLLLMTPSWQTRGVEALSGAIALELEEHRVFLLDRPSGDAALVEALVPGSRCEAGDAPSAENVAERYSRDALAFFEWVQAIVRNRRAGRVLAQLVIADQIDGCSNGLSAVLRTAALENPWFTGQLIIVPAGTLPEAIARLLSEERSSAIDPVVRYVKDVRQVLRWQEVEAEREAPMAFRDSGVYLITGGTGGLGLLFAKEILERAREARVVLTGRSAPSEETRRRMDVLSGHPGRAEYRQMDPADLDQAIGVVAGVRDEFGRLDGILHCAGIVVEARAIPAKSGAEFLRVLAPKVAGASNLDEASREIDLDFFVLFSSIASALGNARTVDYAAANAFLDEFAAHRNRQVAASRRHGRTRSINWPLWEAGGMSIDRAWQQVVQEDTGMRAMGTAAGLRAFYRGLELQADQMLVVEGDRDRIRTYFQKARILDGSTPAAPALPDRRVGQALEGQSPAEPPGGLEQLQQKLKALVGTLLGIKPSHIDEGRAFSEYGLDSLLGADLIAAINRQCGTKVSNARIFDYPNVREFTLFLEQELRSVPPRQEAAAPAAERPLPPLAPALGRRRRGRAGGTWGARRGSLDDRIAVIGMSGRYAGAANLREYWKNLTAGRNSVVEVPPSRWAAPRHRGPAPFLENERVPNRLGALADIDCFDPLFFRISPQEADFIDPHHRLFLQESYRAFEDAGYASTTLGGRKCGVYLGIAAPEYAQLLAKNGALGEAPLTSNHAAIAAARIAYYLNLKGPAISVDTACSSSLVAVHLACQGLLTGETEMAVAGGVELWLSPDSFLSMHNAGMLSPAGQCKAFDDSADGIVVGDGVGAVVLKRLEDAEADGDFIYGVILGSGINQDGRTNGITAPSVNSQIELEREVYAKHGIDPGSIGYVEAHGTGTRLGDPIELEALSTVFKEKTARKSFCAIGSVKSNIGHTASAAGVAGLQKALLSLQHQTLVPTLHVTKESSHFDFEDSPFFVSRETRSWEVAPGSLRRAAVSAFGFSGTNAHLVVEEYRRAVAPSAPVPGNGPTVVPLSARTEEQLLEKVRDLSGFLRTADEPADLADVAYTLQVGREEMEERLAFVVGSVDELAERLALYAEGKRSLVGTCRGRVEPGNEGIATLGLDEDMRAAIDRWIERGKLSKLADLWVRGLSFDWNKLHAPARPRRISLPTYPFSRERHWIELPAVDERGLPSAADSNMKSIEDIMAQLDEDLVTTEHGVQALRLLV